MIVNPPDDLPARGPGRRFWSAMTADYEPEPHEVEMLAEAARAVETLAKLRQRVTDDGEFITSTQGIRTHPALVEMRAQRTSLVALLRALSMPVEEGGASLTPRQRRAVRAANTRWNGSK